MPRNKFRGLSQIRRICFKAFTYTSYFSGIQFLLIPNSKQVFTHVSSRMNYSTNERTSNQHVDNKSGKIGKEEQ